MQVRGYEALLALRSFEDARMGIREEFATPDIGGASTVAVLSTPLDGTPTVGWIICHSYALEQVDLQPIESALARALAAGGSAVLRFHVQGYGDSQRTAEHATLGTHLKETAEAAEFLCESTGVRSLGFIGARFGGLVAALAAEQAGAGALILWDPVVKGRAYMRRLALLSAMTELLTHGRSGESGTDPETMIEQTGVLDVQGFPLTREVFREVAAIDLSSRLSRFDGDALILQVSRSTIFRPDLERLAGRLRELGGRCSLEIVADPAADRFGQPRYRPAGPTRKVDTQETLIPAMISKTAGWALDVVASNRERGQAQGEL